MTGSGTVFDLQGVFFAYKKKEVLKDISLSIKRGESLGIVEIGRAHV
jgi:ABC-type multidrug transport system fused ATPase/permease subunit